MKQKQKKSGLGQIIAVLIFALLFGVNLVSIFQTKSQANAVYLYNEPNVKLN